jgi:hypothetical protein
MNELTYLSQLSTSPFFISGAALCALGAIFVLAGIMALLNLHPLKFLVRALIGTLLVFVGTVSAGIGIGVQGYRALTREDVAARVLVWPAGPQRFTAAIRFADGREASYPLAGDEIYVDARILKWHPLANLLGLHTAYELDRVGGRYRSIEQERDAARTLHSLSGERIVDLFGMRKRYAALAPLLDAEYGSAAFVPVTDPAELEVRVSTTGLLIRQVPMLPRNR